MSGGQSPDPVTAAQIANTTRNVTTSASDRVGRPDARATSRPMASICAIASVCAIHAVASRLCARCDSDRRSSTIWRLAAVNSGVAATSGSGLSLKRARNAALMRPGRAVMTTMWVARNRASSIECVIQRIGLAGPAPDAADFFLQQLACLLIERGERLVHEQDLRIVGQRPGDADALLHATGQLVGISIGKTGEADKLEQRVGIVARLVDRDPTRTRPEGDVLEHAHPIEQRALLKDDAALAAGFRNRTVVEQRAAGRRPLESANDVEERRLAAARGTDHAQKVARLDAEIERQPALPLRWLHSRSSCSVARRPAWPRAGGLGCSDRNAQCSKRRPPFDRRREPAPRPSLQQMCCRPTGRNRTERS